MARNLFSIPIFFIVFRECLEASIIVSVLLGLVEQIVSGDHVHSPHHNEHVPENVPELTSREPHPAPDHESTPPIEEKGEGSASNNSPEDNGNAAGESTPPDSTSASAPVNAEEEAVVNKRLVRKLRFQIFFGALSGFVISLALGAAFVAVWFTQASNLWQKSENLWEGIFSLIA
jgi:high-affinity iron transporter